MRRFIALFMILFATQASAEGRDPLLLNYGQGVLETSATAGTYTGALGSYWNPAGWATMSRGEAVFTWNDRSIAAKRIDNWGILLGGHGFGASMRRTLVPNGTEVSRVDDYQIALAGGGRADYWGLSYGWSKGESARDFRQQYMTVGNLVRPYKYVSIGSTVTFGLRNGRSQGQMDLGLRPLDGSHRVTLFGDVAGNDKDNFTTLQWGAGVEVMPLDGIRIAGKISKVLPNDPAPWFTLGLGFSLDATGIHVAPHYDNDSERLHTNYAIRVGEVEPSFPASKYIDRERQVVAAAMRGQLTYQKSRWFDPGRHSLFETLEWIETAKNDRAVGGIVLNMSGFYASTELAWEMTEKLKDFRSTGKKVYMYVDRPGMTQMYVMSQADYVWMDPVGDISMFGWVMGRTYYKGMLEKLGLGVEEWRYFEYKSAFESLARTDMSPKDREQRQALLDEFHAAWLKSVSEGRDVHADSVMLAIDSLGMVSAHEAYLFGLVDSLGRWDDAPDLIEAWNGKRPDIIERHEMAESEFVDPRWGEYPKIALVYALGECELDTGIRGRYTSKLLRRLAKNDKIGAVVLRVDSPGGDGLASDWVAEQMRVVSDEKPMIVSQGRLAASGGYWISSPADRIFTSPFTITGSIGVIAGWIWNEGLTDKTGLTFDKVMVGKHADLGSGVILPLIGAEVPDRSVDAEERVRVEKLIRRNYDDFVGNVAEDRNMLREDVEAIAQGRVWAGQAAIDRKLVDEIGGMEQAIAYAKFSAGIPDREKVEIVEYPRAEWINWDRLFAPASPLGMVGYRLGLLSHPDMQAMEEAPYGLKVMQAYSRNPGRPLFMLPPEHELNEE